MRKALTILTLTALGAASWAVVPQLLRDTTTPPTVATHDITRERAASPLRLTPRHAEGEALAASFSVQGADAQQTVWSENFNAGNAGWTLTPDGSGYVSVTTKKASGSLSFLYYDAQDKGSLFFEGDYRRYNRAEAWATSPAITVPRNAVFHGYIGYSQNMNDYAILRLYLSTDDFATEGTLLWASDQETGAGNARWHAIDVDLSAWEGQDVKLRFHYGYGTEFAMFGGGGYMADFYIDNLSVTGVAGIDHIDVATGEVINFVDTSTGDIASYSWSFPGGTPETSTEACPSVYYKVDGNYDVTLTVTDADGKTDTMTREGFVTVTGGAPVAAITPPATFRYDDTHLPMVAPLAPVQYFDGSSNFPTEWAWTFSSTTPATSTDENPVVSYDQMHEQEVALTVSNTHGSSDASMKVSVEYDGYISNLLEEDYPVVYDLDGEGSFPGSNKKNKIADGYAERFSKPSAPIVVYGALVFFESVQAESLADQVTNVTVSLCESENGLPGKKLDLMSWFVTELAASTPTTLRGTLFEFDPTVINDEFFIRVDGIPEWNDSCNVSFAMAHLRDHDNTAYFMRRNGIEEVWRPVTGYFAAAPGSQTSFYIMPLVSHAVMTWLPVSTDSIVVPAEGGDVRQAIYSRFGYKQPVCDAQWAQVTNVPGEYTLDTLDIHIDALPLELDRRVMTITATDSVDANTITLRVIQQREQQPEFDVLDVNHDGEVNVGDVNVVLAAILEATDEQSAPAAYDVNGDGNVNVGDVNAILNRILELLATEPEPGE